MRITLPRIVVKSNVIVLALALLPCTTLAQLQNVNKVTAAETKHFEVVAEMASLAWTDLRAGKSTEMNALLQILRSTEDDPHMGTRRFAIEEADMIEARADMEQGKYGDAAGLFKSHLSFGESVHTGRKDGFFTQQTGGDLQLGVEVSGTGFRFADLSICLEKTHQYSAALRVYWAGLRTLMDGSRTEVVSEPIPLTEMFDKGLSVATASRFESACYLMAAISGQQNGDEAWMVGYADKAVLADPAWELARFYASYLPLQFTNILGRAARKRVYESGMAGMHAKVYKTILTQAFNNERVTAIASGSDLRARSATLRADLQKLNHMHREGKPQIIE